MNSEKSFISSFLKNWAPVILWSGFIFYFSTDSFSSSNTASVFRALLLWIIPGAPEPLQEGLHELVRKSGHWAEYFVLSAFLLRAINRDKFDRWRGQSVGWTLVWTFLYALGDEWHQAFVPSRSASLGDVFIDFFGGMCGALWMYFRHERSRRRKRKKIQVEKT
jgi:VanZ family protein